MPDKRRATTYVAENENDGGSTRYLIELANMARESGLSKCRCYHVLSISLC